MESTARLVERFRSSEVELVCPACRAAALASAVEALACPGCERQYPVVNGLPDLRLVPDRFLSMEEDRAKGLKVLAQAEDETYSAALESYWSQTPELNQALKANHLARQLSEPENGRALLQHLGSTTGPLLDLGCGQAGLVEAVEGTGAVAVGLDAAFRWLLVARRRLPQDSLIVCANAETPPFRPGTFQTVVANDLLEHVADPRAVVLAAERICSGRLYLASNNRWSLAPEPHVRLLGVGWLPRPWQSGYVRAFRGHDYSRVRLLSRQEALRLPVGMDFRVRRAGSAPVFSAHMAPRQRRLAAFASRFGPWAPRFELDALRDASRR